jgi:hypothetical protein
MIEDLITKLEERWKSGNSIPVGRIHITREEWDALMAEMGRGRKLGTWYQWTGGSCPVALDAKVLYRMRDEVDGDATGPNLAGDLDWSHGSDDLYRNCEIVAYKILSWGDDDGE